MKRSTLINPTYEQINELRVAVKNATEHFQILRDTLFEYSFPETPKAKFKALYGLWASGKMTRALFLARSFFDDAGLEIPDELYGMNANKRKFYIEELLCFMSDYLYGGVEK